MKCFIKSFLLISITFLQACVYVGGSHYPPTWENIGEVITEGECPSLAGIYQEKGEELNSPFKYSLTHYLLSNSPQYSPVQFATQVDIKQPRNGQLHIRVWGAKEKKLSNTILLEKTFSIEAGDFSCNKNGLQLAIKTDSEVHLITNAHMSNVRIFNRTQDGYLIVEDKKTDIGHALVIPLYFSGSTWVRWKLVMDEDN